MRFWFQYDSLKGQTSDSNIRNKLHMHMLPCLSFPVWVAVQLFLKKNNWDNLALLELSAPTKKTLQLVISHCKFHWSKTTLIYIPVSYWHEIKPGCPRIGDIADQELGHVNPTWNNCGSWEGCEINFSSQFQKKFIHVCVHMCVCETNTYYLLYRIWRERLLCVRASWRTCDTKGEWPRKTGPLV